MSNLSWNETDAAEADRTPAGATPSVNELQLQFWRQIETEMPFLQRTVRRWHRQQADADDLVQDTLVRALANAHLWQPGSDLHAWLFAIMRNQFLAIAVRSSRWAAALQSLAEDDLGAAPDPRETRLVLRDVQAALRRLPGNQRQAVRLVGIEGKSYEEAARIMGLSVGAVRSHLARGRERLRAVMRAGDDGSLFSPHPVQTKPPSAVPPATGSTPPALLSTDAD